MGNRPLSRVALWYAGAAVCCSLVVGAAGVSSAAAKPSSTNRSTTPSVTTASVKIVNFLYKPKTLTIAAGTKVTWKNRDSTGHTVRFSSFGSPVLATGQTWSHKFTTAGTFKYHCTLHLEMTAKVVVTG